MHTFDTDVSRLQIWLQIVRTRLGGGKERIRNTNGTVPSRRTPRVRQLDDVSSASDVSVVLFDAPTQPHSAVPGVGHEDDVAEVTARVESLRLAIDPAVFRT